MRCMFMYLVRDAGAFGCNRRSFFKPVKVISWIFREDNKKTSKVKEANIFAFKIPKLG